MGRPVETREEMLKRMAAKGGWIGVDLDGTLAHYDYWKGIHHIGNPVPKMLQRVKEWLAAGVDVRIFTARAHDEGAVLLIRQWCDFHVGKQLPVTATKDFSMIELWDDRAVQIIPNTGERVDGVS